MFNVTRPAGFDGADVLSAVKQYWLDSYGNIRFVDRRSISHTWYLYLFPPRYPFDSNAQSNTVELIHDAFQDLSYWNGWQSSPQYAGVAMDTHIYQMFSDAVCCVSSMFVFIAC